MAALTAVEELFMESAWSSDVEMILAAMARLPQVRCVFMDPFIWPQGYGEQCRVYRDDGDDGEWMLEFVRERCGSVRDFFGEMHVTVIHEHGLKVLRGQTRYDVTRELWPNWRSWYNEEQAAIVRLELSADPGQPPDSYV